MAQSFLQERQVPALRDELSVFVNDADIESVVIRNGCFVQIRSADGQTGHCLQCNRAFLDHRLVLPVAQPLHQRIRK